MIEAELKARVREPERCRAWLRERADEEVSVYRDTYYDDANGHLTADDRELRLRLIETGDQVRAVLTYKAPPVDAASRSKPEYETEVTEPDAVRAMLAGLGYQVMIEFEKRCRNYRFSWQDWALLATLVTVPEIDGTFVEVETIAEKDGVPAALSVVRSTMAEMGISESDLTTEAYTDVVKSSRSA